MNNGYFEAAGYCYNQSEFEAFTEHGDMRSKTWLIMDKEKDKELTDPNDVGPKIWLVETKDEVKNS